MRLLDWLCVFFNDHLLFSLLLHSLLVTSALGRLHLAQLARGHALRVAAGGSLAGALLGTLPLGPLDDRKERVNAALGLLLERSVKATVHSRRRCCRGG